MQIGGQEPRRSANVLYYVPVGVRVHGHVAFSSDLLRPTIVQSDAQLFSKDRFFLNMGLGTATLSYRPISFEGRFAVSKIRLLLGNGGGILPVDGKQIQPLPSIPVTCTDVAHTTPAGCEAPRNDFLPDVEIFDLTGDGAWVRLPRITAEAGYTLANPTRFVLASSERSRVLTRPMSSVGWTST